MFNIFNKLVDSKFRKPRIWSNNELIKFKEFFYGDILNVSGWEDKDKQGNTYKSKYFYNSKNYYVSNFKKEMRGFQGNLENEFYLDLEEEIDNKYFNRFNVVFNHTTLEHIFNIEMAFKNLAKLTNDILIVVVPFLQEEHGDYGDYWRFTPQILKRLYYKNNLKLSYINYNDKNNESIYIFAIGSKKEDTHHKLKLVSNNQIDLVGEKLVGKKIIKNNFLKRVYLYLRS